MTAFHQLGKSPKQTTPKSVVKHLLDCHTRIRDAVRVCHRISTATDAQLSEIREAVAYVQRYFSVALVLHVQDEDETIVPRLRGLNKDLDQYLTTMSQEHQTHQSPIAGLLALCKQLLDHPEELETVRNQWITITTKLDQEFAKHLLLEETYIIPAIDHYCTETVRLQMQSEMEQRRQSPPSNK